ncbi:hypothetical protein NQ318_011191 [Aromia moschata]|uniref:Uncharacterized protein n=1 Tax=Aromia moschata TaxID=1265417 RepID=A0AAV8YI32_9CUCU|nr:hypothetical protein NQ318_011191 [Aromia moschata]
MKQSQTSVSEEMLPTSLTKHTIRLWIVDAHSRTFKYTTNPSAHLPTVSDAQYAMRLLMILARVVLLVLLKRGFHDASLTALSRSWPRSPCPRSPLSSTERCIFTTR